MKKVWSTLGKISLTILLFILPVIPVWSAPVIPHPSYERAWISLLQLVLLYWTMGVRYRAEWYSCLVFLVVIALIGLVWRGLRRKVN